MSASNEFDRCNNSECFDCGIGLDTRIDDHFVLTEEPRPIPDVGEMEFDDWFRANWVLCPDCSPVESDDI